MKKVLVINTANTGFTGITSVILNYTRATKDAVEYDFVLNATVVPTHRDMLAECGRAVHIPPCSRSKKPLRYMKWLTRLMREHKYDVVHVHGNSGTTYIEMRAAKKAGIPARVVHSHNTSTKFPLAHKVLKPLLNRTLTRAVACSEKAGEWLFSGDFIVLRNAIKIERFVYSSKTRDEYRKRMGLDGKLAIGHVAHMSEEKNHLYLLRIFQELVKREPDARLLLIGDGRLRGEIEKFIADAGLGDVVTLLGKRADVAELYQCMDAFVLPSHFEGLPVTLIEAQTAGLPCFVSDRVTREVDVTNETKFIGIEAADVERWVESLLSVKNGERDRAAYAKLMLESGWNIDNCAEVLLEVYNAG